jgi:hypothetical protein
MKGKAIMAILVAALVLGSAVVIAQETIEGTITAIDSEAMTVTVIAPNGGEILSGTVIAQINATNPAGDIVNLEWLISPDNETTGLSLYNDTSGVSPYLYDLNTTQFSNGAEYLIKGIATNDVGVTAEDISDGTFEIRN